MGRLTEYMFNSPHSISAGDFEEIFENESAALGGGAPTTVRTPLESSILNFMENFQRDDDADGGAITESTAVCKLHVPSWLNIWCIIITVCILAVLIALGLIMRQVQIQKQRQTRTGRKIFSF